MISIQNKVNSKHSHRLIFFSEGYHRKGMSKISKILVPIDGSSNSFRGLNMAITIAKEMNASITIMHSMYEPPRSEFKRAGSMSVEQKNEMQKFIQKAQETLEKSGLKYTTKMAYGNIGYNIIRLAHTKSKKFDMIVIGSRGRGAVKGMFFGSISNYVMHSSKLPVLVVK